MAVDLLMADGIDLRPLPLKDRQVAPVRIGAGAEGWIALTNGVVGEGRALYRAVIDADLEGIVAKRPADAYHPKAHPLAQRCFIPAVATARAAANLRRRRVKSAWASR